jgi:D-beta-D-heptose 7-phosphate kinase/D-beta-D-heptose 1-phosphate adenosyltransferase
VDALASVDDVTVFYEETPKNLIDLIKPNIIVKGTDYEEDEIVGGMEVKSWGGRIVRIPLVQNRGTRFIIEKIVASSQGKKS